MVILPVHADQKHYDPAVEYKRRRLYVAVLRGLHADGALHELLQKREPTGPERLVAGV